VATLAAAPTVAFLFPAGFILIGAAMMALSVKARNARRRWEAAAQQAQGEVTDLRWESLGRGSDSRLLAFPVVRFSLPDGRSVETQSSSGTNPPAAKPGAQVTVLYDPADPTRASLPSGATSSIVTGVVVGLGGLLILVGIATAAFMAVVV
jgi:hypothetical protein